jgi:thioredoxin-dependent peroxiredoxin
MRPTFLTVTILLLGALAYTLGLAVFLNRAGARNAGAAPASAKATPAAGSPGAPSTPPDGARGTSLAGPAGKPIQPGTPAPDFTLPATDGKSITLSSLRGHPVVLYFYPADETPGCTKEACDFRDHTADLKKAGITVLGVSTQDLASHRRFTAKEHIPFPLLSDPDGRVAKLYGVPVRNVPALGRIFGRTTFVIDKDGRVARTWPNVSIIGHVNEVLQYVHAPGGA